MLGESLLGTTPPAAPQPSRARRLAAPAAVLAITMMGLLVTQTADPVVQTNALVAVGSEEVKVVNSLLTEEQTNELDTTNRVFTDPQDVSEQGIKQAVQCIAQLMAPSKATRCGANEHQNALIYTSLVIILFFLFFFSPFYIFPEACFAAYMYKYFPGPLVPVLPGLEHAPEHTVQSIQFAFKAAAVVGIFFRFLMYSNDKSPPSFRMSIYSLVTAFLLIAALTNVADQLPP
jgi:hypothetical protein